MRTLWEILTEKKYDGPALGSGNAPWKATTMKIPHGQLNHADLDKHYQTLWKMRDAWSKISEKHPVGFEGVGAIQRYKETSSNLNNFLRTGGYASRMQDVWHPHVHDIHLLDHITSQKIPRDTTVYRGAPDIGSSMKKGEIYHDKGFTGTSLAPATGFAFSHSGVNTYEFGKNKQEAWRHHIAQIHVPKGTMAHFIDADHYGSPNNDENELLIHRGTHFKVLGHSHDPVTLTHVVHMTVHKQEDHTKDHEIYELPINHTEKERG